MRIYVAGPMRGRPELNKKSFDHYTDQFCSMGHEVFNPWSSAPNDCEFAGDCTKKQLADYMRRDLDALEDCDVLFLMPEWQTSTGANVERAYANYLGIPVIDFNGCLIEKGAIPAPIYHEWGTPSPIIALPPDFRLPVADVVAV